MKNRLRNPRFGMMAVAAAGPGTNLVLATIGAIILGLLARGGFQAEGNGELLVSALYLFVLINIFLAFFNLLPIPPFDGSHILEGLLPRDWARVYRKFQPFGLLLFFALVVSVWLGPGEAVFETLIFPPVEWTMLQFEILAGLVAGS